MRKKLLQNNSFTYRELREAGYTRHGIRVMLREGEIERVSHGRYRSLQLDYSEEQAFRVATEQVGKPSAICMLSALSYYELTDVVPEQVWIMVPDSKRTRRKNIKLCRTRRPRWKVGVERKRGYSITTLERTIIDLLGSELKQLGIAGLKKAINAKQTSLKKMLGTATQLGERDLILPYIEVLA